MDSKKNIFRVQKSKENPYVMINKSFFNDTSLSLKAKGLLGYILTLPDDWKIYENELVNHHKDGRDSVRSAIKELINAGYIERVQTRNEKGRITGYEYSVYEVSTINGKSDNGESNNDKGINGESNTTNNNKTNNKKTNNNLTNKSSSSIEEETQNNMMIDDDLEREKIEMVKAIVTGVTDDGAKVLLLEANQTISRISVAYRKAIDTKTNKTNLMGYLITCLRNNSNIIQEE